MRINEIISRINFSGRIIDSHMHIGEWGGKKYGIESVDKFIKNPLSNGDTVEMAILSSASCLSNPLRFGEINGNLEMIDFMHENDKICSLAVCEPKIGSVENIKKLFSEYPDKFIGLKFHPDCHSIEADDKRIVPYLKFAQENNLPCVFHCGIPWDHNKGGLIDEDERKSSPKQVYEAAKNIADTPVVMAHYGAGGELVHPLAKKVLFDSIENGDALLYTDISWVDVEREDKPHIVDLIREAKEKNALDRIMYGSDAPIGENDFGRDGLSGKEFYDKTISDVKNAIKSNFGDEADEIIEQVFYKNAENLFFKKTWLNK